MRDRSPIIGLMLALLVLAGACSTAEAAGPPDIKYGRDICVQCGMIVSEARFAAAYTTPDGTRLSFDDLGDLLLYQRDVGDPIDANEAWVHDFETEAWLTIEEAYYVPTLSVSTPMGHSILAFGDEGRALAFAHDVDGEVIRWDVVEGLPAMGGLIGHHHMGHDEADHEEMSADEMHSDEMDHDSMDHEGMESDEDQ